MISDYFNSLVSVNKFSEGSAPDYEPSYALQDEFYCLLDTQSSNRIWQEQGSSINIDMKMYCDPDTVITDKDRVKVIEDHIIAIADVSKYHKTSAGSAWTLTASAAIGQACIFYQASTNTGTGRKADGKEYSIYSKKNPNEMGRHFELLLQRS
jgi:hypothetical protein